MTRLRHLDLLLAALLLGVPALVTTLPAAVASADDPEPEVSDQVEEPAGPDPMHLRWDRLLGVELTGGLDTPYGVIGGALVVQPLRVFRIDVGGGGSRDGGRLAGGLSLVLPQDHFALIMRVGFAGGPLTWNEGRETQIHRSWGFAAFFDTSLGLEYRFDEGILIRLFAGVETTINDTADSCSAVSSTPETICGATHDHPARLFLGLSVGYMFDFYP